MRNKVKINTLKEDKLALIWLKAWAFCSNSCLKGPQIPDSTHKINKYLKKKIYKLVPGTQTMKDMQGLKNMILID